ncbi:MAG: 2-hydroxyacyl-CoA dehydratase [Deltaproteobacteria bacterium]|nr:2-hydroxyacyl-CoA dehydratase [Deltaproteobacteria bacterium]
MREALREYPFDWILGASFKVGANIGNATEKEYESLLRRIPTFRGLLEPLVALGEPGRLALAGLGEYVDKLLTARQKGKKIAMTTFCQSPAILYAMDCVPLLMEHMTAMGSLAHKGGCTEYMDYCVEMGFTETSCSSQRGALGAYLADLAEKPDFTVIDTCGVCDTNANAYAFASAFWNIPFYQLNYPPELTGERAVEYHRKDYRNMIAWLEEQTGNPLDVNRLREIMVEIQKQDRIISELQELQRLVPSPLPVLYNLFIYVLRFPMAGTPECTAMLQAMLEVARENAQKGVSGLSGGEENARGLFIYIDHYGANIPLWGLLEKYGISHLGSILDRYYQEDSPFARPEETYAVSLDTLDDMIDALAAQGARMPMVKQIRGPYDAPHMWLEELLAMKEVYQPDFAVYFGTPGCRNTWGMVKPLARELEAAGLPTLILNADVFDERVESWETTQSRLEEFLEVRKIV